MRAGNRGAAWRLELPERRDRVEGQISSHFRQRCTDHPLFDHGAGSPPAESMPGCYGASRWQRSPLRIAAIISDANRLTSDSELQYPAVHFSRKLVRGHGKRSCRILPREARARARARRREFAEPCLAQRNAGLGSIGSSTPAANARGGSTWSRSTRRHGILRTGPHTRPHGG